MFEILLCIRNDIIVVSGGRSLTILRGTGMKILGLMGVTPSKVHWFGPICLLPMENIATFLHFSALFFVFLSYNLLPVQNIRGMSLTEIFI